MEIALALLDLVDRALARADTVKAARNSRRPKPRSRALGKEDWGVICDFYGLGRLITRATTVSYHPSGRPSDARDGVMITLDDEAKAREMLADRGGYLVKANGKFHIMSAEEYTRYTKTTKDSFTSTDKGNANAPM